MPYEDKLQFRCETDVGVERSENQDNYGTFNPSITGTGWLFVVADGMGGAAGGQTASQIAVDTIRDTYIAEMNAHGVDVGVFEVINRAIKAANVAIQNRAEQEPSLRGMGTTAVVMVVLGDLVYTAHVGDSRIYRFRDGRLECMTRDHTRVQLLVDEGIITPAAARKHPDGHIIVRNLGGRSAVEADVPSDGPFRIQEGDVYLLCSDGLYGMVDDEVILDVLAYAPPEYATPALIELANRRGGHDNITVSTVCMGQGPEAWSRFREDDLRRMIDLFGETKISDTAVFERFEDDALSPADFDTRQLEALHVLEKAKQQGEPWAQNTPAAPAPSPSAPASPEVIPAAAPVQASAPPVKNNTKMWVGLAVGLGVTILIVVVCVVFYLFGPKDLFSSSSTPNTPTKTSPQDRTTQPSETRGAESRKKSRKAHKTQNKKAKKSSRRATRSQPKPTADTDAPPSKPPPKKREEPSCYTVLTPGHVDPAFETYRMVLEGASPQAVVLVDMAMGMELKPTTCTVRSGERVTLPKNRDAVQFAVREPSAGRKQCRWSYTASEPAQIRVDCSTRQDPKTARHPSPP